MFDPQQKHRAIPSIDSFCERLDETNVNLFQHQYTNVSLMITQYSFVSLTQHIRYVANEVNRLATTCNLLAGGFGAGQPYPSVGGERRRPAWIRCFSVTRRWCSVAKLNFNSFPFPFPFPSPPATLASLELLWRASCSVPDHETTRPPRSLRTKPSAYSTLSNPTPPHYPLSPRTAPNPCQSDNTRQTNTNPPHAPPTPN